jgi:hypothetical protein
VVRRVQVQADDVADLLDEKLVVAQGEGASSMRLRWKARHTRDTEDCCDGDEGLLERRAASRRLCQDPFQSGDYDENL